MESLPLAQTGAAGIVVIIVGMILWGKLIPSHLVRQRMVEVLQQLEQAKQDRDMWKTAYLSEVRGNRQLLEQNTMLMEVGRTANHLIESLPTVEESGEGRDDQVPTS